MGHEVKCANACVFTPVRENLVHFSSFFLLTIDQYAFVANIRDTFSDVTVAV